MTLTGHTDYVMCIKALPAENLILSGSNDCTVKSWNFTTGKCERSFQAHSSGVSCIRVVGNTLYR